MDKCFEVRSKIIFSYDDDVQYFCKFLVFPRFFARNAELAIWPTLIFARFWAKVAEAVLAGCNIS